MEKEQCDKQETSKYDGLSKEHLISIIEMLSMQLQYKEEQASLLFEHNRKLSSDMIKQSNVIIELLNERMNN